MTAIRGRGTDYSDRRARFEAMLARAFSSHWPARAAAAPFDHVAIGGLDEPWTGNPDAARTLATDAPTRILLMHSPDGLLATDGERFDLALAGHTHGGHVALPGGVPIIVPGPLGRRYTSGRFDFGEHTLLVSRGVGGAEVPFRLFAPADVLIVTMTAG